MNGFRLFFKKVGSPANTMSCRSIDFNASDMDEAYKRGCGIAVKDNLRLVMVAELPQLVEEEMDIDLEAARKNMEEKENGK